jgi:hypothetical protein
MSQIIPIYIPVYIASETYQPARVLPRLLFFNGLVDCEEYYIKDGDNSARAQTKFPYFDNYSVVSGSQFPTDNSKSLLFQNENPSYGSIPTASLYSEYWETYINLLYNPVTRLLNASAIIPLKDYFEMDLNDVVNFRGNYYHLRAINDYSLKTGDCTIQLLGPIIPDTISDTINPTTTTTTTTTSTSTTSTTTTTTTTTTIPPNTIERVGSCLPNQIETDYTITGTDGDVVAVRATFSGQIRKEGSTGDAAAAITLGSTSGITSCYSDTDYHTFSINVDETYTMTGTTLTVNTSAVTWNSFETLTTVTVSILSVNGNPSGVSTTGCRGDSTGGPC